MKVPAFKFTCGTCHGETMLKLRDIEPNKSYPCAQCGKPFVVTEEQSLSIKHQMEEALFTIFDESKKSFH